MCDTRSSRERFERLFEESHLCSCFGPIEVGPTSAEHPSLVRWLDFDSKGGKSRLLISGLSKNTVRVLFLDVLLCQGWGTRAPHHGDRPEQQDHDLHLRRRRPADRGHRSGEQRHAVRLRHRDNLITITDANQHVTHFAYDAFGRVTQTTFPSTLTEIYAYDVVGNLLSKTTPRARRFSTSTMRCIG